MKSRNLLMIIAVIILAGWIWIKYFNNQDTNLTKPAAIVAVSSSPTPRESLDSATPTVLSTPQPSVVPATPTLPPSTLIDVPFTTQAPHANWDATHEEACEEASLIMLNHFTNQSPFISEDVTEQEIQALIKYETDHEYEKDVTINELSVIAKNYYKMRKPRVETNISIKMIKSELANGKPVIVPAAGRELPNPNFKQPGPIYHMLVIKGYDQDGFITNDPGTRKGEGFRYTFDALFNAIHDWNADDITKGAKTYLVFD